MIITGLAVPVLHHEAHLGLSAQSAQYSHGPGARELRGESDINDKSARGNQDLFSNVHYSIPSSDFCYLPKVQTRTELNVRRASSSPLFFVLFPNKTES